MIRTGTRCLPALLLAGALIGCSALAPVRDDSRYYVLNAVAVSDSRTEPPLPDLILGVGPVSIPQYLDRAEIVARVKEHQIAAIPNARWGEPLQPNLAHVLADDLAVALGTGQVLVFPWFGAVRPAYAVDVDVQRFELQETGAVVLQARWTLRDLRTAGLVAVREVNLSEPADHADAGASAAAMSRALARLSEEIAPVVREARHAATVLPATPKRRPRKPAR